LGESLRVPAKSKSQEKSRPRKDKARKRVPSKPAEPPPAAKIAPTEKQERPDGAAAAPALRLHETQPGEGSPRLTENRNSTIPASRVPFAVASEGQTEQAFDEFAMQDIHDPWLNDEIDTLPEEFEMEDGGWQGSVNFEDLEHNIPFSAEVEPRPTTASAAFEAPDHAGQEHEARRANSPSAKAAPDDLVAMPAAPAVRKVAAKKTSSSPKPKRSSPQRHSPPAAENAPAGIALESLPAAQPEAPVAPVSSTTPARTTVRPQPMRKNTDIVKVSSEGDCVELVRQIVKEHPHYGPTMIAKYFETRVDPPVQASRSTIYRWLRLAGLNTRDQRVGFAGKPEEALSSEGTSQPPNE
jgi:hypothetical protein